MGLHVQSTGHFLAVLVLKVGPDKIYLLYETIYSGYAKFRSARPLFLEDKDIFQKSASMVLILSQFRLVPWRPIFELHNTAAHACF